MAVLGLSVLLFCVAALCIYWLLRFSRFCSLVDKIPGPRKYFLVGNAHQLKADPDDWFEQLSGVCSMYEKPRMARIWLSLAPYVCLYGPEEIEPILGSNKHINKSREYTLLQPWLGLGLLTSAAQKWRPRRKLLTPAFHYDILKDFMDVFNEQSKVMVSNLSSHVGESLDLYPYITLCALDIICQSAMGQHVNAQQTTDNDYVDAIYAANRIVHERQKKPWLWPDCMFNWFGEGKIHDWALKILHEFTENVIRERSAQINKSGLAENALNNNNNKRRLAFLDLLLKMVECGEMPYEDVRSEVDTFMFEGHDTTSTAMNWLMHLLGCHPEIQSKVHQELEDIFGDDDRDATFEDLGQLKYLECCIKETLRLFPSVPIYARTLYQDVHIAGFTVPAGTQVVVNPYMVHRDPKHWPDPEIFDPDRFLPENSVGRHPYAFVPFSAGSRNCIGQRFALMEEKTVISWLLRYYSVRSCERRDQVRPKGELILRPSRGVTSRITIRRKPLFTL